MTWHNDGHSFMLVLDKSLIITSLFHCPHRNDDAQPCRVGETCIVETFIDRFGLDCNVGVTEVAGAIEIAWTLVGDKSDEDECQVWVIPVNDEFFSAWSAGQMNEETPVHD